MPKTPRAQEPRRIKSIEVGFRVLRVLEQAEKKMPLRDIAAATGMPASNAYLYLMSFVHEGMAEQDPESGHYGLGPLAIQIGAAALRQSGLAEAAKDLLMRLRQETRNSVFLSVWGNRGPTIVFKIDGDQTGLMGVRVGHVLPLIGTATGRVFLSYLPAELTQSLVEQERATGLGLPGKVDERIRNAALDDIVRTVRINGIAYTDARMSGGHAASAAPVFDQSRQLCAVITMLRPERSAEEASADADANANAGAAADADAALARAARDLSTRLGA